MLDIGWSELLVVAVVAIVVVGPKDLPKMMRTFGHYAGKLRRAASEFRQQFDEAMRESEAEEMRKNIESIRASMSPAGLKASLDKPVMMPKDTRPSSAAAAASAPKPKAKPAAKAKTKPKAAKTKATRAKRRKTGAGQGS